MNYQELEIKLNQASIKPNQHFKVKADLKQNCFIVSLNSDDLFINDFDTTKHKTNDQLVIKHLNTILYKQYLLLHQFERQNLNDKLVINNIFDDFRTDYKDIAVFANFQAKIQSSDDKIDEKVIQKSLKMSQTDFDVTLDQLLKLHYLENPEKGVYKFNYVPYQPSEIQ